ncbi:molybdenum cofactor biosynthesis protein MoaA [Paraburkholderia sp. NMBU_R16]|uniref:SMI1/KNR4 family protein n=1 Tax=Paraburkholderia sp. NMBU_R16 TaxID=2698676 RepID=UPI0015639727|nr:SMI1/KNR4 family protein [Paraburkholderia sp. NMBU_R16]NRO98830.1 molybdenum cofactor biosynthesis protein MoaA [Paraburkholderia sp. NMBU_R16]
MADHSSFPAWLGLVYEGCRRAIPRGLQAETIATEEAYLRVTAEPVTAPEDVPRWPISSCRGYAMRASDGSAATLRRPVVFELDQAHGSLERRADRPVVHSLLPNEVIEVHAHSPLPKNADTVVSIEENKPPTGRGFRQVWLREPPSAGAHIRARGSEFAAGTTLLGKGQRITAERQALLIAAGVRTIKVAKRPRIGVVVSSYERCAPDAARECWQIPDSCGAYVRALLKQWGHDVPAIEFIAPPQRPNRHSGPTREAELAYQQRIRELAARYDLIIGSGLLGVEPYIRIGLNDLQMFGGWPDNKLDLKQIRGETVNFALSDERSPKWTEMVDVWDEAGRLVGRCGIGHVDRATLVNLPGQPGTVAMLMHTVVRRILDLYELVEVFPYKFVESAGPHWEIGELARDVERDPKLNAMLWARIVWGPRGEPLIDPLSDQRPHLITPFIEAETIAAIPAGATRLLAGSRIHFLRLDATRQPGQANRALPSLIEEPLPKQEEKQVELQIVSPSLTVSESWSRLDPWLADHPEEIPGGLNAGAGDEDIRSLEAALDIALPEDFIESLKIHNGQPRIAGDFFDGDSLLCGRDILKAWKVWHKLVVSGDFEDCSAEPDDGIKDDWYNLKWIPFTSNGAGDHLCLDFDPAEGGTVGQVIRVWHDDDQRTLVARSFREWLHRFVVEYTDDEPED